MNFDMIVYRVAQTVGSIPFPSCFYGKLAAGGIGDSPIGRRLREVGCHSRNHRTQNKNSGAECDDYERYNVKVDALTHAITPDMQLYVSFRRADRQQTQLWYVSRFHRKTLAMAPVMRSPVTRSNTPPRRPSDVRQSVQRLVVHCGEFHATFENGVAAACPVGALHTNDAKAPQPPFGH